MSQFEELVRFQGSYTEYERRLRRLLSEVFGLGLLKVRPEETESLMNTNDFEQEIQSKGLTAPRITPEHIESLINEQYFFRMSDALKGTPGESTPGCQRMTICVLVLKNGFVVTGEGVCADSNNFDQDLGRRAAREQAIQKIWALEGYLLRQKLFEQQESL